VYVLRSEADAGFYIGYTKNLRARLHEHQAGHSFATAHRNPWKLIYYEAYLEQADALGRERYLKSGAGRRFLQSQLKHYLRKTFTRRSRVSAAFTRIYTHVLNRPGVGVKSPLD
jgi:putative endonuclease